MHCTGGNRAVYLKYEGTTLSAASYLSAIFDNVYYI